LKVRNGQENMTIETSNIIKVLPRKQAYVHMKHS